MRIAEEDRDVVGALVRDRQVGRAIAEFCAKQPDRAHIEICWVGTDR